jgi:IS30 family transposase
VYFFQKASPWQRPSNQNTNGLLRQYFPKGTDLPDHDAEQLAAVAEELNTRPRKTLGWPTPAARLADVTAGPARVRVGAAKALPAGRVPGAAPTGSA